MQWWAEYLRINARLDLVAYETFCVSLSCTNQNQSGFYSQAINSLNGNCDFFLFAWNNLANNWRLFVWNITPWRASSLWFQFAQANNKCQPWWQWLWFDLFGLTWFFVSPGHLFNCLFVATLTFTACEIQSYGVISPPSILSRFVSVIIRCFDVGRHAHTPIFVCAHINWNTTLKPFAVITICDYH